MQQSCINHQMAGISLYCLRNCFLVFLLLVHFCRSRLIGPTQPIIATVGEDITLPCHLVPGENVAVITFEWTRPDLDPRFVFLWRAGQDLMNMKNPSYKGRSSLFTDELKHGNISLKLSKVKPADEGRYRCYIPEKDEEVFIDLVVASSAVSSPVINLEGTGREKTGVMLECKSEGWHPEPELLWLDGEGNLLSAGPTETLRGPDDLYTVSSRVTVEKRHSNNITCRVQQRNTNQSRETHIHVPDEYFQLTSSSPIIIGVVVSLALSIILILIVVFFIWRRNKNNLWKPHCLRKKQETTKTEPDQEQETLMTQNIETSGGSSALTKHQQLMEQNMKKEESNKTELEKNQHAAEEKLKEEHHHLEKKHVEISNMKKEEKKQEADTKLKKDEKLNFQQEMKQPSVKEHAKQLEKKQEAEKKMKEANEKEKEKKHAEISNIKKEEEKKEADTKLKKDGKLNFQQQMKQPSVKEHAKQQQSNKPNTPQKGDIILDEVDRHGSYICLKNTSSEDKLLTHWDIELQINKKKTLTYKFERNSILKAGEGLTLRGAGVRNPHPNNADLPWQDLCKWRSEDDLKISLISSSGEKHQLEKNQHAEKKMKEANEKEKEKKHAEISNMKKEEKRQEADTKLKKDGKQNFQQEMKQPDVKEHAKQQQSNKPNTPQKGDIILDEVDRHGLYICLKNTSSEDILMAGWKLKLQRSDQTTTYTFKENFTLKPKQELTVRREGVRNPYPDNADVMWAGMTMWKPEDNLKIALISSTGECHRLK